MTVLPQINPYTGTIPNAATQSEDQFADNVYPWMSYINATMVPQMETHRVALNTLSVEIGDAASAAQTAEANAVIASNLALSAVNYKGDWVANYNTVGYQLNDSISYTDGYNYVSKVANNLIEPTSMTNTAEWNFIEAVNPNLVLFKSGGSLAGAINTAKASVASSATTSDIWTGGNVIDFTGTATVTAFPNAPQAGAERTLICAGACSFTAGANMLIDGVTSGQSVTCVAGDTIIVRAISTTQFKLTRLKADGTAQVSPMAGSMVLLSTINASGASTVDVETGFSSTYDDYIIIGTNVSLSTTGVLQMQYKINGAYVTTATYIEISNDSQSSVLTATARITPSVLSNINFKSMHYNCNGNTAKNSITVANGFDGTNYFYSNRGQYNTGTGVLSGIRFLRQGGGTLSGVFKLYGIKKA